MIKQFISNKQFIFIIFKFIFLASSIQINNKPKQQTTKEK